MSLAADGYTAHELQQRFAAADWTFVSRRRVEEFHPYPARYIPEIPSQVLDLLGIGAGVVLDPFCGSGTTLAAAQARGLPSIGVDINPIACLISRVRTSSWLNGDEDRLGLHIAGLKSAALQATEVGDEFAEIPRLDHWFPDYAQVALSGAVRYVRSLDADDPWRDRVAAAISAATVRVSRQDSDTRYAAIDKNGDQTTTAEALARSLSRTGSWLAKSARFECSRPPSRVINGDARDLSLLEENSVSAACFSPPYPNAYEYWLYHKYRMYWLGFDAVAVRKSELGARPHYSRKNGLTEEDFADQMREVMLGLGRVLRPGSRAVVIVGDSVIGGREIDNGALVTRVASETGFSKEFAGSRKVATSNSSFNRAHSRGRKSEHILVFRNDS